MLSCIQLSYIKSAIWHLLNARGTVLSIRDANKSKVVIPGLQGASVLMEEFNPHKGAGKGVENCSTGRAGDTLEEPEPRKRNRKLDYQCPV